MSLESSDEQQEIQEMGLVEATSKQRGSGITVSLESSEEQQKVQGMGSVEATNKQRGTGITVLLESSVKQQEIQEMGSVETTSKHGTGITVLLESSDEQQEIQEMGSAEATSKQHDTGDLSNNDLSGQVPSTGSLSLSTPISFANNPNICGPGTTKPSSGASHFCPPTVQSPGSCSSCIGAIGSGVVAGATLLLAVPAICCAWCRCRKSQEHFFDVQAEDNKLVVAAKLGQLKRFSLRELIVATDSFSTKNIVGRGGLGDVYKGRVADGSLVAVKRLKEERTPGMELQFQTEIEMSGMVVVHRNLLRLLGFCMTSTEALLVYPYMANGSVASRLREREPFEPPLDWQTRLRIALGSARGLSCLHDQCGPKIIHRNIKATNILLDEDFEAVVGHFNLAKLMDHKDTDVTTAVRGTIGHIAPEYLSTGKCSQKSDVFAYGMMLLELITGQRAFDLARLANDDDVMLLDWVKGLLKKKSLEVLIDPDIGMDYNYIESEVQSLIQVALLCTQGSPMDRPQMSEVVRMLEGNDGLAERCEEWQELELPGPVYESS